MRPTTTTQSPGDRLLKRPEAAEAIKVSIRTLDDLTARGFIGVVRWPGNVRIPQSEIDRFIAEHFEPAIDAA